MGVHGLWQLLHAAGQPVTLESLEGKTLAVDVSIWLNKAAKGMRDKLGNPVYNAHLILIFHRICKLLFYNIKPVFVFDGGVPELKKRTIAIRRQRKVVAKGMAKQASQKIVNNYLKGKALAVVTGQRGPKPIKLSKNHEEDIFNLPPMPITNQYESSSDEEIVDADTEWMTGLKSEKVEKMFENIGSVDFESEDFKALPPEVQHELLTEMKDSYRRRYNKKKSQPMPQEAQDFSDFQLKNLFRRGKITQSIDDVRKTMNNRHSGQIADLDEENYFGKNIKSLEAKRVASEDRQHYILMKKSGKKGGENILFNTDLEVDKIDIYKKTTKNENFERLERDPAQFKEAFIDNWTSISFISDSSDESDFDCDYDKEITGGKISVFSERTSNELINVDGGKTIVNENDKEATNNFRRDERVKKSSDEEKDVIVEEFDQNLVSSEDEMETEKQKIEDTATLNEGSSFQNSFNLQDEVVTKKQKFEDVMTVSKDRGLKKSDQNLVDAIALANNESDRKDIVDEHIKGDIPEPEAQATIPSIAEMSKPLESDSVNERLAYEAKEIETEVKGLANDEAVCLKALENEKSLIPDVELMKETITTEPELNDENISLEDGDVSAVPKPVREESIVENLEKEMLQFQRDVQGQSLEKLSSMQNTLHREQESLQRERERQTRAAASVGNKEYEEVQELLRLFGIPFLISPMEAEAQCAVLDMTNLTDGSMSDDSDIFLFGAKKVFKNIFNQEKYAEMYTADNISHVLNINRERMIAIAFLSGSDYTEGVQGVGSITAMEILQEFGGDALQPLIRLRQWFDEAKQSDHLASMEQMTKLKTKLLSLELPRGFPNSKVWEAYISPTVDCSEEPFEWGRPDLTSIREFAREKFGWISSRTDEVLLPVMKNIDSKKYQKRMENYFPATNQPHSGNIESKRLKRVVNLMRSGVTNNNTNASCTDKKDTPTEPKASTTTGLSRLSRAKPKSTYIAPKITNVKSRIPTVEEFQKRVKKSRAGSRARPRRPAMSFSVRSSKLPNKDSETVSSLCLSGSSSDSDA